jgi:cystathionine beta-lyase/cystathionine gamma-synthase
MDTPRQPRTLVTHPPDTTPAPDNRPLVAPLYQSVKFQTDTLEETQRLFRGEREGYFYSRGKNPTTRQLELTVAALQGREDAVVVGSGIAAMSVVLLGLLQQGDHVVTFIEGYAPTRQLLKRILGRYGVTYSLVPVGDHAALEAVLSSRPVRMVLIESPTNPILRIADLAEVTRLCRHYGALSVLDNTFAGLHQHGQFPVDLYVHSLTKYANGHGDVLAGAVIGAKALIDELHKDAGLIGPTLDAHAAWLVQRGLKTYFVRYEAQCRAAALIATWLELQPGVTKVRYPGLPSHPQYQLARAQAQDMGTVVTFDLDGGYPEAAKFCDALELFGVTASLGSTDSLVMPPQFLRPYDLTAEQMAVAEIGPGTVRLSIGLEDPADLQADLHQALEAAAKQAE